MPHLEIPPESILGGLLQVETRSYLASIKNMTVITKAGPIAKFTVFTPKPKHCLRICPKLAIHICRMP